MVKKEFLDILRESLAGNIPVSEIEENIRYYKDYIENGAESEEEALKQLGDPHLIARTIIDSFKASKGPMADFYTEQARNEYSSGTFEEDGSSAEDEDNVYTEFKYKTGFGRNFKWYKKLILGIIIIGIISLVLFIGGLAIAIILRIILPVVLVLVIIKFIADYFRRG
ncbi:MAG: DUF1700 domain-containing protein [Lachnospiraceae bacterium]|nr:DUF1700 domain-containing protein [Lachnospiraceae bacterium]